MALSHGSDLDVWAERKGNSSNLAVSFKKRSIFKYFPINISKYLIKRLLTAICWIRCVNSVVYFPVGFNQSGDSVINSLVGAGPNILARYDISFEPLQGVSRKFKTPEAKLVIFSGVRFLYETFPEGNEDYSKGNDIIIRGLAKYLKRNPDIEVHFVEKGEDVLQAKRLCDEVGIDKVVVWHKEMPFKKMIDLYLMSDICFDQVGPHWLGAIGAYALYLGNRLLQMLKL